MDFSLCSVAILFSKLISVYILLLFIYGVLSWLPGVRGRWTEYLAMAVEPVLIPVRRVIPPLGGIDISFMVVLLLLRFLQGAVVPHSCFYSSGF